MVSMPIFFKIFQKCKTARLTLDTSMQLEVNERIVYDKKRKLRQAIESGKPFPTELRDEVQMAKSFSSTV